MLVEKLRDRTFGIMKLFTLARKQSKACRAQSRELLFQQASGGFNAHPASGCTKRRGPTRS